MTNKEANKRALKAVIRAFDGTNEFANGEWETHFMGHHIARCLRIEFKVASEEDKQMVAEAEAEAASDNME